MRKTECYSRNRKIYYTHTKKTIENDFLCKRMTEKYHPVLDSEWMQNDCCSNVQMSFLRAYNGCRSPVVNSYLTLTHSVTRVHYSVWIHPIKETLKLIDNSYMSVFMILTLSLLEKTGKRPLNIITVWPQTPFSISFWMDSGTHR